MPPKNRYHKEDLVNAAFYVAEREGLGAVTVRKVAAELGCSVAPIYVNFNTSTELIDAVLQRAEDLTFEYMQRDYSESPFLNMGIGEVMFAREHGRLFREITMRKSAYAAKGRKDYARYLPLMKRDKHMRSFSEIELIDILIKVDVFTQGLAMLASEDTNKAMVSFDRIIDMLRETGADIILGAQLRKTGDHPI